MDDSRHCVHAIADLRKKNGAVLQEKGSIFFMKKNIGVIRGDGIGPEIIEQALKVLDRVAAVYGHSFKIGRAHV